MSVSQEQLLHEEIFASTKWMRTNFRCLGLFPFVYHEQDGGGGDGGYRVKWKKWQAVSLAQTLVASVYVVYSTYYDFTALIPSPLERYVLVAVALELLVGVLINISCIVVNGKHWPAYFGRCSRADRLLAVGPDRALRRLSRLMFLGFTAYVIFLLHITLATGVILLLWPHSLTMRPTYAIAFFFYSVHWTVCSILPELFTILSCSAITSRLRTVCARMRALFLDGRPEVCQEVETLRIVYQLLMDTLAHINGLLGPLLVTTGILHVLPAPLLVYSFVKQGETDVTAKMFKMMAFGSSLFRVAVMCFIGQMVHDQSKEVVVVLRDAPSAALSSSTNEEIVFFMNCTRLSSSKISAWGFLDIDTGYFQSVVGAMVVYTITIMQFEMAICPSLPVDDGNNNCSFPVNLTEPTTTLDDLGLTF